MLFKRESINEDVTQGAPAMFSFSSPCKLSRALDNGPPVRDPILETLTMDLGGATGTGKAGCLFPYTSFSPGESYVCLGRETILRVLIPHSPHGKPKWEFRAICRVGAVISVRLGKFTQKRSLFLYAPGISPRGSPWPSTPALIFTSSTHTAHFHSSGIHKNFYWILNSGRGETGPTFPRYFLWQRPQV